MEIIANVKLYYIYLIAFILAFLVSNLMTPISKSIAYKVGALDHPKARGVHKETMPLAGGIAIYVGFMLSTLLMVPIVGYGSGNQFIGLITGATLITVVGLLDDVYQLSPRIRMIFQIFSALIVIMTGTTIDSISFPFIAGARIEFGYFSSVITLFWIVGITNAVNFIDGLDGLAAGVAAIASFILTMIAIFFGDPAVVGFSILLTATLTGSCLGFLPFNFNPAKIFMGDTGSTFLGFTLAVISIQTMLKTYTALTLVVAVLILGLPIFDTTFAILRRAINRRPIHVADRGHLHHRLVDSGLSHKRTVITLYFISGTFGITAVLIMMKDFYLAILIVAFMLAIWLMDMALVKYRKSHPKKDTE